VPPVFIGDICNALTLTLWDEAAGKLVAFRGAAA
jgi:hypothetical protein